MEKTRGLLEKAPYVRSLSACEYDLISPPYLSQVQRGYGRVKGVACYRQEGMMKGLELRPA